MTDLFQTNLAEAFKPVRDLVEADYVAFIRMHYERLCEKHGPTLRPNKRLSYSYSSDYAITSTVIRFSNLIDSATGEKTTLYRNSHYQLDEEKLAKGAAEFAKVQVAAHVEKLVSKLEDLENTKLVFGGTGSNFLLTGTKNGHKVSVKQQSILKQSKLGKLFNQFPARIYVDGKFTPEAKFREATES